jgi:hypothetical protein
MTIRSNTKPGTRVVCIDDEGAEYLKRGHVYTVLRTDYATWLENFCVSLEECKHGEYWLRRFRYLQTEPDEFGEVEDDD